MEKIRTNYENWYSSDDYYWGTEPADFLNELIKLRPLCKASTVLDIGCGEGKDAVYLAQKGYSVTAFDITKTELKKQRSWLYRIRLQ